MESNPELTNDDWKMHSTWIRFKISDNYDEMGLK